MILCPADSAVRCYHAQPRPQVCGCDRSRYNNNISNGPNIGVNLIDALDREDIQQAREMTFEQKFIACAELFDYACGISKSGIRWQNPTFTEEQVMMELRRRVSLGEREIEL